MKQSLGYNPSGQSNRLPGAMVIGPMKAGTTWIYDYLSWRGDVSLPSGVKETFFFDKNFVRGLEWYRRHFSENGNSELGARLAVEVAPSLFHDESAPSRVADTLGSVPVVVTLRDPLRRSWSHYVHLRRKGYTRKRIWDAALDFPEIIDASEYEKHLFRWQTHLQNSKISVLWLEDLARSQSHYIQSLCNALNISEIHPESDIPASNVAGSPRSYHLAKVGRLMANSLRDRGAYSFVNIAKRMGLKKLFFGLSGSDSGILRPDDDDLQWLSQMVGKSAAQQVWSG